MPPVEPLRYDLGVLAAKVLEFLNPPVAAAAQAAATAAVKRVAAAVAQAKVAEATARPQIVVSGAGGKGAACNGTYTFAREHEGRPLYRHESGRSTLYFNGYWKLSPRGDLDAWCYSHQGESFEVPIGPWGRHGYESEDVDPCPTVSVPAARPKFVVSGAGGKGAPCNGTYAFSREHEGRPLYKKEGGAAIIYFKKDWKLNDHGSTQGWYYSCASRGCGEALGTALNEPPTGQWSREGYNSPDVEPCPIVTLVEAGPEAEAEAAAKFTLAREEAHAAAARTAAEAAAADEAAIAAAAAVKSAADARHSSMMEHVGGGGARAAATLAPRMSLGTALDVSPEQEPRLGALTELKRADFAQGVRALAALFEAPEPPTACELRAAGTLAWLTSHLEPAEGESAMPGASWAAFESAFDFDAFGANPERACVPQVIGRLIGRLHNVICATESLRVEEGHLDDYEDVQIHLHQLDSTEPSTAPTPQIVPATAPRLLCVDALLRVGQLAHYVMCTSAPADPSYLSFCARLVDHVIEERPSLAAGAATGKGIAPYRRATIERWRRATPLGLLLHRLVYVDGSRVELVLATRDYRIVGRRPPPPSLQNAVPSACKLAVASHETGGGASAVPGGGAFDATGATATLGTALVDAEMMGMGDEATFGVAADDEDEEEEEEMEPGGDIAGDNPAADADAPVHTVVVRCPDGFEVDDFFGFAKDVIRQALGAVHASGPRSGQHYTWPERGWAGSDDFESSLRRELDETRSAVVARRQTYEDAATLLAVLEGVLVAEMVMAEAPPSPRRELFTHVEVRSRGEWQGATIVDALEPAAEGAVASAPPKYAVVYDDGRFETRVSARRVRSPPNPDDDEGAEEGEPAGSGRRPSDPPAPPMMFREFSAFHEGRRPPVERLSAAEVANFTVSPERSPFSAFDGLHLSDPMDLGMGEGATSMVMSTPDCP